MKPFTLPSSSSLTVPIPSGGGTCGGPSTRCCLELMAAEGLGRVQRCLRRQGALTTTDTVRHATVVQTTSMCAEGGEHWLVLRPPLNYLQHEVPKVLDGHLPHLQVHSGAAAVCYGYHARLGLAGSVSEGIQPVER